GYPPLVAHSATFRMRTTLKRGIGRVDGNGNGSIPVTALTPMTRYKGRKRGPFRLIGKILLWTFVVLLVAAGALAGGAWLFINQSVSAVRAHTKEVIEAQNFLAVPNPHQPTVAMVLGYDRRTHGVDAGGDSRSDTIMLIRADP